MVYVYCFCAVSVVCILTLLSNFWLLIFSVRFFIDSESRKGKGVYEPKLKDAFAFTCCIIFSLVGFVNLSRKKFQKSSDFP